jgi:predicted GNAT superfamily acetyltransferase
MNRGTGMTETITLRDATAADSAAIVALNDAVVAVTSPMDAARLGELQQIALACTVAERDGVVLGFVLAMRDGAAYDNGNFRWFAERLTRFAYVDRVVIAAHARGLGLGTLLYDHLAAAAAAQGCLTLCAEIDHLPPNPGSLAFHQRYGFVQLGTRALPSGKIVAMQIKGL